jgi:large conductance mechanosensitive channel
MPVLGKVVGGVSFNELGTTLGVGADGAAVVIKWGAFLQTILDFTLIALALFVAIKTINRLKREPAPAEAPPPPRSEVLLEQIRDALRKG